jgi:PAS domain S-box-containing protein
MTRKRILIVEDDAIIGWHMERSLNDLGYRVVGVIDNGEEAVHTASSDPPDLVLMDIGLKGKMDGIDTAWLLRHQLNVPVVYLTAYTDTTTLDRAKHTEPYGYLRKPFDDQALRATIEMALHKHILELELKESERRYRQLFSTMQEGFALHEIILDEVGDPVDYRFLDANPVFEQMTGLKTTEIIGKTILEILPETEPHWIYTYGQVAKTGQPVSFENFSAALGKYFRVAAFCPSPGHFATLFSDTTEKKLLELGLQRNEKRLRTLTEAASSFIYEIDPQGIIRFANRLLPGMETDQVVGSPLLTWYPQSLHPTFQAILDRVYTNGQPESTAYSITDPQANSYSYLAQFTPLSGSSGVESVLITTTDITVQKQAELALAEERALLSQRVEERTAALSIANTQLARAARTKDEFLASMSHELRTPLTGILGLTEALQKDIYGPSNDRMRVALRSIEESGQHLLALINDILDLSKIEAGRLELEFRPVSLQAVCESALRLVRQSVLKKALRLSTRFDPNLDHILSDERRLKQILVNLLSNAVKFTPERGEIGLETQIDAENKMIHLTVWDTGIGMRKEDIERLFKPFVQLDSSLSRPYPGTGLGLSLVMKLVELHGGGIMVDSEPNQGSRFTINLPWRPVDAEDYSKWVQSATRKGFKPEPVSTPHKSADTQPAKSDPLRTPPAPVPLHSTLKGVVILIAEDNDLTLNTLTDFLISHSAEVIQARNGSEAVELTRGRCPDVILMDVQMPVMDGFEAIRRIRAEMIPCDVPIITLTALAMIGDRERCLKAGATEYLSKPVNLDHLVQTIQAVLSEVRS